MATEYEWVDDIREHGTCPKCGSGFKAVHPTAEGLAVVICRGCGWSGLAMHAPAGSELDGGQGAWCLLPARNGGQGAWCLLPARDGEQGAWVELPARVRIPPTDEQLRAVAPTLGKGATLVEG